MILYSINYIEDTNFVHWSVTIHTTVISPTRFWTQWCQHQRVPNSYFILNALGAFRRRICRNGSHLTFTRRNTRLQDSVNQVWSHAICTRWFAVESHKNTCKNSFKTYCKHALRYSSVKTLIKILLKLTSFRRSWMFIQPHLFTCGLVQANTEVGYVSSYEV